MKINRELKDITISTLVLALAFSKFIPGFPVNIVISLFIVSFVFVLHELGHRTVARFYGCFAEYKLWGFGLMLALLTAILPGGFIFAAPGAVYISPIIKKRFAFTVAKLTKKEFGIIGLSGPLVNIIIGFSFLGLSFIFPALAWLFLITANISFFLALFNLIPFPPLDGQKIFSWNKIIWGITAIAALSGYMLI